MVDDSTPARAPDKAASGELRSVDEWAKIKFPATAQGFHPELWKHVAASALHGWPRYAHNNNGPLKLTAAAYDGAIKAASTRDKNGACVPFPAALGREDSK